jgi:signal transduction histidine kinase
MKRESPAPDAPWTEHALRRLAAPRYAYLVLVGFGVATASFVGSTLYADGHLEAVAQTSHQVSDNAMPSIVALATMRRELVYLERAIEEEVEGDEPDRAREAPVHRAAFEGARREYERLPTFPGETELWVHTRTSLNELERVMRSIEDHVANGDARAANAELRAELEPAERATDDGIAQLIEFNHRAGQIAAVDADKAWTWTRRLSILLDLVCATVTAALAATAYFALRRYAATTKLRAEELEAFASRVAHDIRSPLQPAMLALQSIAGARSALSPDRVPRLAERGLRGIRHVLELVEDLLAFAQGGAAPEKGVAASLAEVCSGVAQDLEPQASAARIEVHVEEMRGCRVACTPGVLTSIVLNLVGNSIKHFPEDKEPRRVAVRAAESGGRVRVEVADTGGGVAHEDPLRVFEPYVRVGGKRPGLGLGLATVRRLVESYEGKVGVRSRQGDGSVFWFELPAAGAGEREVTVVTAAPLREK